MSILNLTERSHALQVSGQAGSHPRGGDFFDCGPDLACSSCGEPAMLAVHLSMHTECYRAGFRSHRPRVEGHAQRASRATIGEKL